MEVLIDLIDIIKTDYSKKIVINGDIYSFSIKCSNVQKESYIVWWTNMESNIIECESYVNYETVIYLLLTYYRE